ncbi:pectin degradation protein [Fusarium langsethiae]|uniref:Pectin degradation protein n=1 Tax=Fusarium langsethiae TaxID=179993 RepID=A0A0M9EPU1_FUSLA|nr:pectin degradation protein [Fusarium langsethiae]
MATQVPFSGATPVNLTVTVGGSQLDVKSASEKQPETLRKELIRALGFVTLSSSDFTLIELQEKFRIHLGRPRSKTPDRLAAVTYSCRNNTFHEALWETQIWRHGGRQLVDAVYNAISSTSLDGNRPSDTVRVLQLLEVGGQPSVTAFHLMDCPTSREDFEKTKDKFFAYGGTFALAACAVAISDDVKVLALLERLSPNDWQALVSHMFRVRLHMDLVGITQRVFTSKERPQTKRCRIGPAPRKHKSRNRDQADSMKEKNCKPRSKRRRQNDPTQHTAEIALQFVSSRASPTAMHENPKEPTTAGHDSLSYSCTAEDMDNCLGVGTKVNSTNSCPDDGDF